ncbi:MAG: PrgI family protein [Ruminococcus sp.]|nr:PrgI family protein [Ruminococcus sp.]
MSQSKHFVKVPKDLNDIKQKFMFGLTKRQCICFGIGAAIGFPMFFITKRFLGLSGGIVCMGVCASPAIICGIYKKNGLYFDAIFKNMMAYFKKKRKRIYQSTDILECIERQLEYNKLKRILKKAEGGK